MFAIAYRMLGTASDAEDIVQDAWLRWSSGGGDASGVDVGGELARVVTTLCLTRLESARAQRDVYDGPWLPEPVLTASAFDGPEGVTGVLGPLDIAAQRQSVSFPVLHLLERLTPPERASCVLRDAFEYSHREVAELLGTTEANARELHARARRNVEWPHTAPIEPERWQGLVDQLFAAAHDGDVESLERMLREDCRRPGRRWWHRQCRAAADRRQGRRRALPHRCRTEVRCRDRSVHRTGQRRTGGRRARRR